MLYDRPGVFVERGCFYIGGNYFSLWSSDEDLFGPLSNALIEQARVYEEQINENNEDLERRATKIRLALRFIWLAPITALIAGAIVYAGFGHIAQLADWVKSLH